MATLAQGAVIADKYRLEREISHGGMGSVWLGHHLHLDVPIAIKFMRAALVEQASARSRFEREAKAAALIRSPHVVHIYDHGVDGDVPFIVMEYLEGQDLRHRLKGRRRLPPDEAVRICKEVCKGLHRAHENGIVHRDLKPGNIWLSAPDDDMVKLLDFGIAKETGEARMVRSETTNTGQLLGSPHYMSPEQARGQAIDGRSDLWSLAVIMFRGLTGKRPFDGDDIGDLIVRICMDAVPPVSSMVPALGPSADAFFARAFDRKPDNRFQNAREFAQGFAAALASAVAISAEDSASWDRVSGASFRPSSDGELATPSTGSARFANMVGPLSAQQPDAAAGAMSQGGQLSELGFDTLAATTAPAKKRRRLVGGVMVLLALGTVAIIVASQLGEETLPKEAAANTRVDPSTPAGAASSAPAPPPSAGPTASVTAVPSSTAKAAEPPKPTPRSRPRAVVPRPRPKAPPVPAPAPKPKPKPKNPFGY